MSTTTVYRIGADWRPTQPREFANSFRYAMQVWASLAERYTPASSPFASGWWDEVQHAMRQMAAPECDWLTYEITCDEFAIRADRLGEAARAFREFDARHRTAGRSHLAAMADEFELALADGANGVCIWTTNTTDDPWIEHDEDGRFVDDDGELVGYDFAAGERHRWVGEGLLRPGRARERAAADREKTTTIGPFAYTMAGHALLAAAISGSWASALEVALGVAREERAHIAKIHGLDIDLVEAAVRERGHDAVYQELRRGEHERYKVFVPGPFAPLVEELRSMCADVAAIVEDPEPRERERRRGPVGDKLRRRLDRGRRR